MSTTVSDSDFSGFPGVAKATAIPNLFFATVLPRLAAPGDLLAFLWTCRIVQEQRGEARFVTPGQVWAEPGAALSFEQIGRGRKGLDDGLAACAHLGALLSIRASGAGIDDTLYFVNNPQSRRVIARARAGLLELIPETVIHDVPVQMRPDIFRIYEEHIGTITPFVAERLVAAADHYPGEWIVDAFREAAELNARNWRYVERILEKWDREGRGNEAPGRDSLEERRRRFLGGDLGHIARYR